MLTWKCDNCGEIIVRNGETEPDVYHVSIDSESVALFQKEYDLCANCVNRVLDAITD